MKLIDSDFIFSMYIGKPKRIKGGRKFKYEDAIIHEICERIDKGQSNRTITLAILIQYPDRDFTYNGVSCLVSNIRSADEKRYRNIARGYKFYVQSKVMNDVW